jgi:membrane protein
MSGVMSAVTSRLRRLGRMIRKVVQGLFIHHAFDHAATMAFYFFLGMIPLLVFVGLLVGSVVQREGAEELAAPLYRAMPHAASELLRHELYAIADANAGSIAPLSIAGFLWLTTNGVHNLMDVFEILVKSQPRSWFRQRLIAVMWVAGTLAAIAGATWTLLWVNGAASDATGRHLPRLLHSASELLAQGWKRYGILVMFSAMLSVGLAIFYRTSVRHPPGVQRKVWSGTFVALALWLIVSWAFGTYVRTIADYAVFYGSLATVAVILLWLYLTSLALVVGAEVNAVLEGMRDPDAPPSDRPPAVEAVPSSRA